jgi:hypothetical protein
MLAARSAKTYELQEWLGKPVTVRTMTRQSGMAFNMTESSNHGHLVEANQFYLTLDMGNRKISHPLKRVEISYDHKAQRLELQIEGVPAAY